MMETEAVSEDPSSESASCKKDLLDEERLFKIREDLQPFFEVANPQDLLVRCKLWRTGKCKFDGVNGALKYNSERGWFPFERHLVRVHKFSYENLIKGISNEGPVVADGPAPLAVSNAAPKRKRKRGREAFRTKCCVVCREFCLGSAQWEGSLTELLQNESIHLFPGSEGCPKLNQQLFYVYFLRNIVNFPASKCEKYLKQCKGARMPETWIFLCSECKNLVSKAAELEEQILILQKKVSKIHNLVKEKTCGSVDRNVNAVLSDVATEVRKFILEPDIPPPVARSSTKMVKPDVEEALLEEPSFENDDDWNDSFHDDHDDLDWDPSVENSCTVVSQKSRRTRPSRSHSHKRNKPSFVIEHEVEDDSIEVLANDEVEESTPRLRIRQNIFLNENETESELRIDAVESCIKIDTDFAEPSSECLSEDDFTTETRALEIDNTEYPVPESAAEIGNNDDDDCDYAEEEDDRVSTSEDASDDSDFAPSSRKKKSSKTKEAHNTKKASERSTRPTPVRQSSTVKKPPRSTDDVEAETEYVCEICQSKYKNKKRFRDHQVAHEISKALGSRFECPQCGYPCTSEKARNIHISYRHGENSFQCSLCSFVAPRKRQLTQHIRQHRNESINDRVGEKFLCNICNRLFISYRHLCKHKRIAHYKEIGIEPKKCEHCTDTFSTAQHLKDHIVQTHQKASRYYCEICGKGTLYMSKLRRHMKSHQKDRCYICEICGADFQYSETMKAHIKKEHPDAALGNQPGENSTKSENNQNSSNMEYTCKHCGVQLSSQSCLSRHIKTHTELFGNKCDLCGKGYATAQSLKRHKDINHTSNQVPCPYCDKTFPHKEYIRAHYKFCKLYPGRQELMGEPLEDSETGIPVGQPSQTLKLERESPIKSSEQLKSESSQNMEHEHETQLVISPETVDSSNIEFIQQTDNEGVFGVPSGPVIIPAQFRLVVTTEGYHPNTQHWTKDASE